MVKHNNVLPNVHLRKHMQRFVKTWFNQPARKHRRAITRQDKAVRIFPRPLEKLRPVVHSCTKKYNSKLRYGRGFTLQEIKKAGLTKQFAQTIGISVDHRRQDTSEEGLQLNVQRLATYKSNLILFPKKAGKPKKGMVPDSTAERLKSVAAEKQNTHKHVLGKPKTKLREKPQKITKELQAVKAFRKLRQSRINKRYKGKREKKAREQAEQEATKKKE